MARSGENTIADSSRQDRAVSAVIGFILMFGILIVGWSIYQGFVIPDQNEQTEFEHNRKAQTQFLNVKDAVLRTGSTGVTQSTTVQVGAEYARRGLAVNLGLTGGTIRTRNTTDDGTNTVILNNVTATDGQTAHYIKSKVTVNTKSLVYEPIYSNYKGAPNTVITGGAVAVINERTQLATDNYNFSIADQVAIKGQTITIVSIAGNLSKSVGGQSSSITVDTEPLSVAERSVSITKTSGTTNITLSIPTQIKDQSVWQDSAGFGSAAAVKNVSRNGDRINVTLKDQQYTLRMMKVGVGSGASAPGATYLTDVDIPVKVREDTSADITLEVRDKFNNPVSGVQVNASIKQAAGGTNEELRVVGEDDKVTSTAGRVTANSSDGQVTFNYTAPNNVDGGQSVRLNFSIKTNTTQERVFANFTVVDTGGVPNDDKPIAGVAKITDNTKNSQCNNVNNPDDAKFTIDYSASDTEDISKVKVEFINLTTATVVNTKTDQYNGNSDTSVSGSKSFSETNGQCNRYKFVVTATDSAGQKNTDDASDLADGD